MKKRNHTIEKIGGTSMSRFVDVMNNVIIGNRKGEELYNRVFVVSAYGGITNLLLEDKKTGAPGVYGLFAAGDESWTDALEKVRGEMHRINAEFASAGLDVDRADEFVDDRVDGIHDCLRDLMRLRSYGHFSPKDYLPASREFLSAVGEAHSAYNSAEILKANGVNAYYMDLTGWKHTEPMTLDQRILSVFEDVDLTKELPIATGYAKYDEGIMTKYDRGYSEITFSKMAVLTEAKEGVIHKEFHLSTGDPKLMGVNNVRVIGNTNFDIADQLSDMGMEAIHPKASKDMELNDIPIRVKNAFEPEHPGTLISRSYISEHPTVDMICGRKDILALEVFDPEMVGECGYDFKLLGAFAKAKISYIAKNTNANTISHFIPEKSNIETCVEYVKKALPTAQITTQKVAIVSVLGSNMKIPGFLSRASNALANADINILALDQCMRQVNMQFIVAVEDFDKAQIALHKEFVETHKD
jgi:aspartate kinase